METDTYSIKEPFYTLKIPLEILKVATCEKNSLNNNNCFGFFKAKKVFFSFFAIFNFFLVRIRGRSIENYTALQEDTAQ